MMLTPNQMKEVSSEPDDLEDLVDSLGIKPTPKKLEDIQHFAINHDESDTDSTIVRFGAKICFRGILGKYLAADEIVPSPVDRNELHSRRIEEKSSFLLGLDGDGIGHSLECFAFCAVDGKESSEPLTYGTTVSLKAPGAKNRLLGIRESNKLGFWRNLCGSSEKWTILKASSQSRNFQVEDTAWRGKFVHMGDTILLQAGPLLTKEQTSGALNMIETLLSLHESADGITIRLVSKDRIGLGGESWQIERYQSLPHPPWLNRPYLSGRFILTNSILRIPNKSEPLSKTALTESMLNKSPSEQSSILVRDFIYSLAGVEGCYIRIHRPNDEYETTPSNTSHEAMMNSRYTVSNGMPSLYAIHTRLKDVKFRVEGEGIDVSLAEQVSQLLPLCEYSLTIREFIRRHSSYDYGLISHALTSEVKIFLREFDLLVAQLEDLLLQQKLSLYKLSFILQPAIVVMRSLSDLCHKLDNIGGGEMLNLIYKILQDQGDVNVRKTYTKIFQKALVPFLGMLENWLFRGNLTDIYDEFMVKSDDNLSRDTLARDFNAQYWEGKYGLVSRNIPSFISSHAAKVLVAGKYLTVVRDLNPFNSTMMHENNGSSSAIKKDVVTHLENSDLNKSSLSIDEDESMNNLKVTRILFDLNNPEELHLSIDRCYRYSSHALLSLLEQQYSLSLHLRSLRRFFLLEHGDFFTQFMDIAQGELSKEVKDIRLSRIQSLLQLAVQTSTLLNEVHRENLTCSLEPYNLIQHLHLIQSAGQSPEAHVPLRANPAHGLRGVEALTLNYSVKWPVSIVLSRKAITKYQLLSRMLFFSKYAETRVLGSWRSHQGTRALPVRRQLGPHFCLRQRMLHFLQNLVYYMTAEVVQPRDHEMQKGLATARHMDEVLFLHERFLDTCLQECLLASQDLLNVLTRIIATCLLFCDHVAQFADSFDQAGPSRSSMHPSPGMRAATARAQTEFVSSESQREAFGHHFALFQLKFDSEVREFLARLWNDARARSQLANLCARLDFNGYYSQRLVSEGS